MGMAKLLFVALALQSADAFVAMPARTMMQRRAAAVTMADDIKPTFDTAAFREYEECVVDAENAAEIAACSDMRAEPSVYEENFLDSVTGFFTRMMAPKPEFDVEECIVQSENAAEAESCRQ